MFTRAPWLSVEQEDLTRCKEDIQLAFKGNDAAAARLYSTHDPSATPAYNTDGPSRVEAILKAGFSTTDYEAMVRMCCDGCLSPLASHAPHCQPSDGSARPPRVL